MAFQRKKPEKIGTKAPLPGFTEPALATAIAKVPSGERRVREIKFDGYTSLTGKSVYRARSRLDKALPEDRLRHFRYQCRVERYRQRASATRRNLMVGRWTA